MGYLTSMTMKEILKLSSKNKASEEAFISSSILFDNHMGADSVPKGFKLIIKQIANVVRQ